MFLVPISVVYSVCEVCLYSQVRQDKQIRELKSHIRSLESASGRSLGSSGTLQHSRTPSDVVSDSNTTDSSCSSERSSACLELSSKGSQVCII